MVTRHVAVLLREKPQGVPGLAVVAGKVFNS